MESEMTNKETTMMDVAINAVADEMAYQDDKWKNNEKDHTVGNWILLMEKKLHDARSIWAETSGDAYAMSQLLCAVAVGMQALSRNPDSLKEGIDYLDNRRQQLVELNNRIKELSD